MADPLPLVEVPPGAPQSWDGLAREERRRLTEKARRQEEQIRETRALLNRADARNEDLWQQNRDLEQALALALSTLAEVAAVWKRAQGEKSEDR